MNSYNTNFLYPRKKKFLALSFLKLKSYFSFNLYQLFLFWLFLCPFILIAMTLPPQKIYREKPTTIQTKKKQKIKRLLQFKMNLRNQICHFSSNLFHSLGWKEFPFIKRRVFHSLFRILPIVSKAIFSTFDNILSCQIL